MIEALFCSLEEHEQYVGRLRGATKVEGDCLGDQVSSFSMVCVHLCTRSVLVEIKNQRVVKYLFKHVLQPPSLGKWVTSLRHVSR